MEKIQYLDMNDRLIRRFHEAIGDLFLVYMNDRLFDKAIKKIDKLRFDILDSLTAAECSPEHKIVTFDCVSMLTDDMEEIKDTILHELCHILAPKSHHGKEWKKYARHFGVKISSK